MISDKKIENYFSKKKADINKMVREDSIDNGVAFIPVKVSGIDDIISHYSVKGHESLNSEFVEYVKDYASDIPSKYPLILCIVSSCFSSSTKQKIAEIIKIEFMYELGEIQRENKKRVITFAIMTIIMMIGVVLIQFTPTKYLALIEFAYVLFWFGADVFVSFIFFDGKSSREDRILAARLASMYIDFEKKYDEESLTLEEAEYIKEEIIKDK